MTGGGSTRHRSIGRGRAAVVRRRRDAGFGCGPRRSLVDRGCGERAGEERLAEVLEAAWSPFVDRLTTVGAVQELLGGVDSRGLTPSERVALVDALGQLNAAVYGGVGWEGFARSYLPGQGVRGDVARGVAGSSTQSHSSGPGVDFSVLGNGLPSQVVEVLQGLSPVVADLVGSGGGAGVVARQLDLLRDAVIDGVTSEVLPGVDGRVLVQAREDLATLWDGYLVRVPQESAGTLATMWGGDRGQVPQEGTWILTSLWLYVAEGARTGSVPAYLGPKVDELSGAWRPRCASGSSRRYRSALGRNRAARHRRDCGSRAARRSVEAGPEGAPVGRDGDLMLASTSQSSRQPVAGVGGAGARASQQEVTRAWEAEQAGERARALGEAARVIYLAEVNARLSEGERALPGILVRPVDVQLAAHFLDEFRLPQDLVSDVFSRALGEPSLDDLATAVEVLGLRQRPSVQTFLMTGPITPTRCSGSGFRRRFGGLCGGLIIRRGVTPRPGLGEGRVPAWLP